MGCRFLCCRLVFALCQACFSVVLAFYLLPERTCLVMRFDLRERPCCAGGWARAPGIGVFPMVWHGASWRRLQLSLGKAPASCRAVADAPGLRSLPLVGHERGRACQRGRTLLARRARFMLRRSNLPPPISSARALWFVQMGGRQRPFRFAREGAWRCDVSCAAQTKPFAR